MAITYKQSDLVSQVWRRVDDQPSSSDVVEWLNAGMNIMANRIGAVFPMLNPNDSNSQFVFDDKWTEIPVIYACARFKQADLMYPDADRYMQQFGDLLKDFVARYDLPEQYIDSPQTQQYVASAGQTDFVITGETFDPNLGNLRVYKNNLKLIFNTDYTLDTTTNTFSMANACAGGEFITAAWDLNETLEFPPYAWFTSW